MKKPSADKLLAVIRGRCLYCCGESRKMVDDCKTPECPLWPYRNQRAMQTEDVYDRDEIDGQIDMFGKAV